jgi:hypothetical protein
MAAAGAKAAAILGICRMYVEIFQGLIGDFEDEWLMQFSEGKEVH